MTTIIHPEVSTDEFNERIKNIHYFVTQYGIDQFKPTDGSPIEGIVFRQHVHEGWKKAQDAVIREILLIQDEVLLIKKKIKNHNKNKRRSQSRDLKKCIEILNSRSSILQKAIDAIIWQVFRFEDHILKRMFLNKNIDNVNRKSLLQALEYVDEANKDINVIAVCCDLSLDSQHNRHTLTR